MINVDDIKIAIDSLPEEKYSKLRNWFLERDWEKWDRRIARDSEAGKLDFLIDETLSEKSKGTLKDLY